MAGAAGRTRLAARRVRRAAAVLAAILATVLIWLIASPVLGVDLPLTGPGMTSATRLTLALMHLAVACVLVPGLTGPRR